MELFDIFRGKDGKKPAPEDNDPEIEKDDDFSKIADDATNEALNELGLSDDEGFDNEAHNEIEDGVRKEMESGELESQVEEEVKKKFGILDKL